MTIHNYYLIYMLNDEWLIFLVISLAFWGLAETSDNKGTNDPAYGIFGRCCPFQSHFVGGLVHFDAGFPEGRFRS